MNKDRRKQLAALAPDLDALVALISEVTTKAEDLKSSVESIRDDEQEYLDNMPESLQAGEKGERAQEAIGHLETLIDGLDNLISAIGDGSPDDWAGYLGDAQQ